MSPNKLGTVALLMLPLLAGGLAYASTQSKPQPEQTQQTAAEKYTCPLTGEVLPCRCCCPIEQR